jgi:hypothetical protein
MIPAELEQQREEKLHVGCMTPAVLKITWDQQAWSLDCSSS